VVADELSILTKSLLPLPDKWHGLADVEKRYRWAGSGCTTWITDDSLTVPGGAVCSHLAVGRRGLLDVP